MSLFISTYIDFLLNFLSVEKREQALKKMMHTVLGDKEKIEDTIVELDYYKKEALQSTWKIVNKLAYKN